MKIIDSHVHIGKNRQWDLSAETVLQLMERYHIDFAILSNVEGCEFDDHQKRFPDAEQTDQIALNEYTALLCSQYSKKLKGLFWIKPHTQGYSPKIETFIQENRQAFCGIKVHPTASGLKFAKDDYKDYLDMCGRLGLPMVVHTADDEYSRPSFVHETAKQYPDVKFVMVHMGLGTDHREAIRFMKDLPNLYGDTTLVDTDSVIKTIKECGSDRILFGSDSPTFGLDSYQRYERLLRDPHGGLSRTDRENLLFYNAVNLFHLDAIE